MDDSNAYEREVTHEDDHETRADTPNPSERGKWISALVALLGLWLVVQTFLLDPVVGNLWSDLIVGTALVVLGGYDYYRRANERLGSVAVGAFVALLGLWLVVTPFVLGSTGADGGFETDIEFWNDVVVGLITLLLGAYSVTVTREAKAAARPTRAS